MNAVRRRISDVTVNHPDVRCIEKPGTNYAVIEVDVYQFNIARVSSAERIIIAELQRVSAKSRAAALIRVGKVSEAQIAYGDVLNIAEGPAERDALRVVKSNDRSFAFAHEMNVV